MTQSKSSFEESINKTSLLKAVLTGTGIGLLVILFFITGAETKPEWPDLWKIRPLIITPLAGAFAGALFYILENSLRARGLNSAVAIILSVLGFMVALWLGVVLGLDGTLWD